MALFPSEWCRLLGIPEAFASQKLLSTKEQSHPDPLSWPLSQGQFREGGQSSLEMDSGFWAESIHTLHSPCFSCFFLSPG